jgi:hypothetical protein
MKNTVTIFGICALLVIPVEIQAQGSGTTVMDFLNIGVSAKSSATGGALSAICDGPVSSYYNPAGLSVIDNYQVAGMHTEWYQDLRYEYLGWGMPVGGSGGFGLSFSYLTYGSIEAYSETGVSLGKVNAYDMALNLSYGHRIYKNLSLGLGIKGVTEKLDDVSAKGIAGDFGLQYRQYRFAAGLSVMNFGPHLKYGDISYPLPTTINAGVSYKPFGPSLSVILGGRLPTRGDFSFRTGLEYSYDNVFMLRGGYDTEQNFDGKGGLSFGAGINVYNHNLDYAYNMNDIMGGTHQISFVFKFGKTRSGNKTSEPAYSRIDNNTVQETYTEENDITTPVKEEDVSVQESYTEPVSELSDNSEVTTKTYQVCAARYHNKESAQKHVETLKKFGVDSHLYYDGAKEYRVVLKETDKISKAENIKQDFEKKGVFCFIHEL